MCRALLKRTNSLAPEAITATHRCYTPYLPPPIGLESGLPQHEKASVGLTEAWSGRLCFRVSLRPGSVVDLAAILPVNTMSLLKMHTLGALHRPEKPLSGNSQFVPPFRYIAALPLLICSLFSEIPFHPQYISLLLLLLLPHPIALHSLSAASHV